MAQEALATATMAMFQQLWLQGSMPLTDGSGSGSGSWIRILLFSSLTFKMPAKNKLKKKNFSAYDFLKLHLPHFSKIKIQKESQYSRNQGFSSYFCMMIEGSGSGAGSGSIPLNSGSGSGRPKNMWIRWIRIRIRIRNTGLRVIFVLLDPDPIIYRIISSQRGKVYE